MSKELFLIRHGQTEGNVSRQAIGHTDMDLTARGIEEVHELAEHLKSLRVTPSEIFVSPLLRARRTAEIIRATLGGNLQFDDRLKEINYGDHEGADRDALWDLEFGYHSEKMREGKAETVIDVEKRVKEFMETLDDVRGTTLVVAHGVLLSVFSQILLDLDRSFLAIQGIRNADYNYFDIEDGDKGVLVVKRSQTNVLRGKPDFMR